MRKEYLSGELNELDVEKSPFKQFEIWFQRACSIDILEPNGFALATVGDQLAPSIRMLLLKSFSTDGFVFATNYNSRKGKELALNSKAAMLFWWASLEQQIRIEGSVVFADESVSNEIFLNRPKGSQIAAIASPQSTQISSRDDLELLYKQKEEQVKDQIIKRPDYWGAYRLIPESFEFWQGRQNRLHDRIKYQLISQQWQISRIAP